MYRKKKILDIEQVYTVNAFRNGSGYCIGAGSETTPEVYLYDLSNGDKNPIPHLPGGTMSFLPVPGKSDLFVSIMGHFPPFRGSEAGIYLLTRMENNWESGMAYKLPYAFRCETLNQGGKHYLVAITVSRHKEGEGDWSLPGEVHVIDLEHCEIRRWRSAVVENSISKLHGICRTRVNGSDVICFCGSEGIFYLSREGEDWSVKQMFYKGVSELSFMDLDGDGLDELVTIEPFHGNFLNVYKQDGANWTPRFRTELSYGHGLSAGIFKSEPTIVVGNRSGSLALEAFVVKDLMRGDLERRVIEEGAGATQTRVFTFDSVDYIVSANQKKNEVVLYS